MRGRRDLAHLLHRRIMSLYELLERGGRDGLEPWCRLWHDGHGGTWLQNAEFTKRHASLLTRALLNGG